jgi:drug/metabolite transporter (DMT)-like permease
MRKKRPLTLFVFLLIVSTDALETAVQFCFKKAALAQSSVSIGSFHDAVKFLHSAALNPFLWIALFTVFVLFCLWITVLSKIDLSVAIPVASFSYITIPLISIIFFGEKITILRWLGIGFIILGVVLVSLSSHKEGEGA